MLGRIDPATTPWESCCGSRVTIWLMRNPTRKVPPVFGSWSCLATVRAALARIAWACWVSSRLANPAAPVAAASCINVRRETYGPLSWRQLILLRRDSSCVRDGRPTTCPHVSGDGRVD